MDQKRCAVASKESLKRIFTVPEAPDSTLSKIELEISSNLAGFLNENIAAIEKPLHEIEKDFQAAVIPAHLVSSLPKNNQITYMCPLDELCEKFDEIMAKGNVHSK